MQFSFFFSTLKSEITTEKISKIYRFFDHEKTKKENLNEKSKIYVENLILSLENCWIFFVVF
jgi:hypothetical protein